VSAGARWLRHALVLLGFLGAAVLVFSSVWAAPSTTIAGVGGDPQLAIWFTRWVPFAVSHGLNPFLTDYVDYPAGVNLMWNTASPLLGVLLWPVTDRFGPVVAYNLAETLALASSAWVAYLAFSSYVRGTLAAAIGGLLFGFSPYMISHSLGHPSLTVAFTVPLMLLVFDDILVRQRRPALVAGAVLALVATTQLLISEELLAAEGIVVLAGIAVLAALHRDRVRSKSAYIIKALAGAGVMFLFLASVPLGFQFLGPQRVSGSVWGINSYVSDLLSFVVPTRLQAFAPSQAIQLSDHFSANVYEWSAYLGIPLIGVLAFAAIRYRSSDLVRFSAIIAGFVALLSMGPVINVAGHTTPIPVAALALGLSPLVSKLTHSRLVVWAFVLIWAVMALVPIANDLLPGRLMVFVFLFAGLVVATVIDQAQPSRRLEPGRFEPKQLAWRPRLAITGLTALALVTLLPRQPYPTTAAYVPSFFTGSGVAQVAPGSVALVAPFAYDWRLTLPMLWQAESGMRFRMPEGFVWIPSPSHTPLRSHLGDAMAKIATGKGAEPVSDAARPDLMHDLDRWQVSTVLVGPMAYQDQMVRFFSELLGRPPQQNGGVYFWLDVRSP
jgi:hypothetical protein